jgi:hypothetical protein
MRIAAHVIMVATGVVGLISPALAADMTGAEIKAFISGRHAPSFPRRLLFAPTLLE